MSKTKKKKDFFKSTPNSQLMTICRSRGKNVEDKAKYLWSLRQNWSEGSDENAFEPLPFRKARSIYSSLLCLATSHRKIGAV